MKNKKGLKITLIIFLVIILGLGITAFVVGSHYKKLYDSGKNFDFLSYKVRNFEYEDVGELTTGSTEISEGITQVYIDWAFGKVIIEPYDGDTYKIEEDKSVKKEDQLQWHYENSTLYVNFRKSGRAVFKDESYAKTLRFLVPNSKMDSSLLLDVWTVSGDIVCNDLSIGDIDTVTQSGNVVLKNHRNSTCSFQSDSGNIDVELYGNTNEFTTVSGNVIIRNPEDQTFSAIFDTISGEFKSDFEFTEDSSEVNYIYGEGKSKHLVSTESGNLTIKKSAPKDK